MKKLIFIILGVIYYFIIQVNMNNVKYENRQLTVLTIQSRMPQTIKLHIQAKRNELKSIRCNKEKITFPLTTRLWFERVSEEVSFHLQRGNNHCEILTQKNTILFPPILKQKLTYFDYVVLFSLLGIPFITLLFSVFIWLIDKIKNKYKFKNIQDNKQNKEKTLSIFLLIILFMGIIIRIVFYQKFGITHFQHDWHGHVEFIKYISDAWTLPLGAKGLQFPQQPLYYVITGGLYSILTELKINSNQAIYYIGYFSLFCSFVSLYYGYKFFTLVSQSRWVQVVAMSFLSFTPSLVYMSARINNDVLVMALSAFSLYHIVKSYQTSFEKSFYHALIGTSLLFMTKISAAPMEILLFSLLLYGYFHVESNKIKQKLYIFSLVGMFFLGLTLLKDYLPVENSFHMVNSSESFPGQIIKSLDVSYFGTYNLSTLLSVGYSHVFGEDAIRYSFLTYQYGTMFFGEFKYATYFKNIEGLKEIMQIIFLMGIIYIIGLITYIIKLRSMSLLYKMLFLTVIFNFLLILKFIFSYSVVCNTDFRYFVMSYILFAFIFAKGLEIVSSNKWIRHIINIFLGIIIMSEILFFSFILSIL